MDTSVEKCLQELVKLVKEKERTTLTELVRELEARGYDKLTIIQAVHKAEEENKIRLVEKKPTSLRDVLLSPHALDLWFVYTVTILTILLTVVFNVHEPPGIYVRYIVGSLFVLFIPGYSLIQCLYPLREELTDLERLALGLGLSLAVVPLVGLILNYTPFGIRLRPIVVSLSALSLALITGAVARRVRYLRMTRP